MCKVLINNNALNAKGCTDKKFHRITERQISWIFKKSSENHIFKLPDDQKVDYQGKKLVDAVERNTRYTARHIAEHWTQQNTYSLRPNYKSFQESWRVKIFQI